MRRRWPSFRPDLGIGAGLLLIAAVTLPFTTEHLSLSGAPETNEPDTTWVPGVIALVLTLLALLGTVSWLIWHAVAAPPTRARWVPILLTALAVVATVTVVQVPPSAFGMGERR